MNLLKYISLCFSLFISSQSLSQDKLVKVNFIGLKYQYQGVKYKEKMLPKLFKNNKKATILYKEYKTNKLVANTLGVACIITYMVGRRKTEWNGDSYDYSQFLFLSMIPGTLGLIFNPYAKSKRKKAIKAFNNGLKGTPEVGMSSPEIKLGLTANGVGICFIF